MFRVLILLGLLAVSMAFAPARRMSIPAGIMRKSALSAKEGDKVPDVVFKARVRDETIVGPNPFKWKDVTSSDLFSGKRVVVFALPGAFTPTCSSTHLPGYESKYGKFYLRACVARGQF